MGSHSRDAVLAVAIGLDFVMVDVANVSIKRNELARADGTTCARLVSLWTLKLLQSTTPCVPASFHMGSFPCVVGGAGVDILEYELALSVLSFLG